MDKQIKILLIEPTKYQSLLIEKEIHRRIPEAFVLHASTSTEVMRHLRTGEIKTAIIDLDSLADDGMDILRLLNRADSNVQIIAVASEITEDLARSVMEYGADELLYKDPGFHVVVPRIVNKLRLAHQEDEVQEGNVLDEVRPPSNSSSLGLAAAVLEHEINNPLMTILGMTELVLENVESSDPETARKMLTIRKSARRIQSVLKTLSTSIRTAAESTDSGPKDRVTGSQEAVK